MRKTTNKLLAVLLAASLVIGGAGGIAPETHAEAAGADLVIHSAKELNSFAESKDDYAGKIVRLANDIQYEATDEFLPISSNTTNGFAGTFDGCGYTISGIQSSAEDVEGLFGTIAKGGIVKNVTVKDSCFDASVKTGKNGAIADFNYGTIDNCHNRGTTARSGIAGSNNGEIKNCTSTGDIYGKCAYVGGIVGDNSGNIYNSCNLGNVRLGENGDSVGGIVGYNDDGNVINCYNAGYVTADSKYSDVGGIIGDIYGDTSTYRQNYYSEESAGQTSMSQDQAKAMSVADMRTDSFVTELNKNCSSHGDWLKWEFRSPEGNGFPLPEKRVNLKDCDFQPIASQVYDGKEKQPEVTVTYQEEKLENGIDYQVIYHNNTQVGDATAEIEGLDFYMDSVTIPFTIVPAGIEQCSVNIASEGTTYNGTELTPEVTVMDKGRQLVNGTDYTITYENNINPGQAVVTIEGIGNYQGEITKNFTIKKAAQKLSCQQESYQMTTEDSPFSLNVTQTEGDGALSYASSNQAAAIVDQNGEVTIKGAGTATITVTAAETDFYSQQSLSIVVTVTEKQEATPEPTATATTKPTTTETAKPTATAAPAAKQTETKQAKTSDSQKTSLAKQSVKVKTLKKRKIKVSWKKDSAANGYQIQYSTSSGFSKGVKTKTVKNQNTTSKTLSKLKKGKKYYVRVRSYKTVSGSTQKTYGAWSSAKKSKKIH